MEKFMLFFKCLVYQNTKADKEEMKQQTKTKTMFDVCRHMWKGLRPAPFGVGSKHEWSELEMDNAPENTSQCTTCLPAYLPDLPTFLTCLPA